MPIEPPQRVKGLAAVGLQQTRPLNLEIYSTLDRVGSKGRSLDRAIGLRYSRSNLPRTHPARSPPITHKSPVNQQIPQINRQILWSPSLPLLPHLPRLRDPPKFDRTFKQCPRGCAARSPKPANSPPSSGLSSNAKSTPFARKDAARIGGNATPRKRQPFY